MSSLTIRRCASSFHEIARFYRARLGLLSRTVTGIYFSSVVWTFLYVKFFVIASSDEIILFCFGSCVPKLIMVQVCLYEGSPARGFKIGFVLIIVFQCLALIDFLRRFFDTGDLFYSYECRLYRGEYIAFFSSDRSILLYRVRLVSPLSSAELQPHNSEFVLLQLNKVDCVSLLLKKIALLSVCLFNLA